MNELSVLHAPKWYATSGYTCTPDNGFLYASTFTAIYIPPFDNDQVNIFNFKEFNVKKRIRGIQSSPDWSKNKYFAILTDTYDILVFDIEKEYPLIKGQNCHHIPSAEISESNSDGAFCFATSNKIYSIDRNVFVDYCVSSNTFKKDKDFLFPHRNRYTILKVSPYNPSIIAGGTKNGLILIGDLETKDLLFRLRGHDSEITSLDFMKIEHNFEKKSKKKKEKNIEKVCVEEDLFDVYSTDHYENEFGTIRDTRSLFSDEQNRDAVGINENFNFVEECQNLKEAICGTDSSNENDVSNNEKLKDFVVVTKDEIDPDHDDLSFIDLPNSEEQIYLASGAKDSNIWIWNVSNGNAIETIPMRTPKNSILSNTFTVLSWIDESNLITNDPSGDLVHFNLQFIGKNKIKYRDLQKKFKMKGIFGLCTTKILNETDLLPNVWSVTMQREIFCTKLNETCDNIVETGTLLPTVNAITECPLDPNKIAIACVDRRICVLNLTTIELNGLTMLPLMSRIQSKVLSLAWHPKKENVLAYGTHEGQAGIYDSTKSNNVPIRLKPFCGKPIYSLTWGTLKIKNENRLVLFACGDGKFVYFPESGENKLQPQLLEQFKGATEATCCDQLIGIGTKTGQFYICDLMNDLNILHQIKLSNKYISSISFNPIDQNLIAVSSMENDIYIFDLKSFENKKILKGHLAGVASVKWSPNSINKLVSSSFDHSIRVWDTNLLTTISVRVYNNLMFTAIFSPIDENFIICGGTETTVEIFDSRNYNDIGIKSNKDRFKSSPIQTKLDWAIKADVNDTKNKKHKKDISKNLVEGFDKMKVTENDSNLKLFSNFSTVLYLTNKEMNRDAATVIQNILNPEQNENNENFICHQKLFSTKRSDVQEVVEHEIKNIKTSSSTSIGRFILPQILGNLKEEIMEKIEKQTLSEEYIALAPYVSYTFWQQTCKAYANQCIEKGFTLNAIPYLIASHEINESIESLCKSQNYREAWIICKLCKEIDDPKLNSIFDEWINYLVLCGNFLGAALLYVCNNKLELALDVLNKIKNPTDEVTKLIEIINGKIN